MLITDKLIYIELHKTGCSHTRKVLSQMFADDHVIAGKHTAYDFVPKDVLGDFEAKLKVGNIRNPWDWYVSLWAFGCQKRGGIYKGLVADKNHPGTMKTGTSHLIIDKYAQLDPEMWRKLYSDPDNYENFNTWLSLILAQDKHSIGDGYKSLELSNFAGLLTFRYLMLYTYRHEFGNIDSAGKLEQYDAKENFIDFIIKNENLHKSLIELSDKLGYGTDSMNKVLSANHERTNSSERKRDYKPYYTDKSIALVAEYEQHIINKYDYQFE